MNACVETVSPVENAPTLVSVADFADAPAVELDVAPAGVADTEKTENLISTEMELEAVVCATQAESAPPEKRSWFARWLRGGNLVRAAKTPHIAHVGVDAFFASVEQVLNPKLQGKPVLVVRGAVASASHEAKLQGVKTGMSLGEALLICPKAIVMPGQYEHYADFAERLRRILETYTPAVETATLDDFYLDFAGTEQLYPDFAAMLRRLQAEILGRTGLSVSIGAARTKVVASIASRLEWPRGLRIVLPHEEKPFMTPLPVEKLPGIGAAQAATLVESGVATIGQLRLVPKPVLKATFGEAMGEQIWLHARGRDGREVMSPSAPRSVSRETTIEEGTIDAEFLGSLLQYLSERIGNRLRENSNQAIALGVLIRYADHYSAHQTVRLIRATNDQRELLLAAKELFATLFTRQVAIRHIGVNVTAPDTANSMFYGKSLELREHKKTNRTGLLLSTPCLSR